MRSSAKVFRGRLPDGACVSVSVKGGRIEAVTPLPADAALPWLLPVLVDLQQNGAFGTYYYQLPEKPPGELERIGNLLRQHGVGRCLMTVPTYDLGNCLAGYRRIAAVLDADASLRTLYFGIFHEGNFISKQDGWRGAHMRKWVIDPDYDRLRALDEAVGGRIRVVNVAPEEPGGLDFVAHAKADGKIVAMGHCTPDAETVSEAVKRGASWVTHFGNGMAPMLHRFKNPIWSYLSHDELRLCLIGDGFHLPPEVFKAAFACKGRERCMPVSDATAHSGCPPGHYDEHGGNPFEIEPNGFVHLADSELLHGAWFQLDRGVEFLVRHLGLTLVEAWDQCSRIPAEAVGLTLPRLASGEEASFILARWDDGLVIEQSVHLGVPYLVDPVRPATAGDIVAG